MTMSTEAAVAEILTLVQQQAPTQERSGRRTWAPVDLSDVLDGRFEPPQPTVGARRLSERGPATVALDHVT